MGFHGLLRDHQVTGYFGVRHAAGDEREHFGFPFGQALDVIAARAAGCAYPGELGDEAPGHARREQGVSRRYSRTASASSRADASLSRKPLAPARSAS